MTDTLDDIGKRTESTTNSRLSFLFSIVTILFIYSMNFFTSSRQINSELMLLIYNICRVCFVISSLLGMLFTIRSFYKKEPSVFFKWTGAILNTLLFILTIFVKKM